ncbi:MAG: hypothetical protein FJX23_01225 [Alphaproteobacteria bacterium]|nr:hypothetical protein [Alphaproteobacteria bacterium]
MSISATTLEDIREDALLNYTVGNAPMGMAAAKALGEALAVNTSLKSLSVENHNLGDEGVAYLAEALHKNSTLEDLNLRNNAISPKGMKLLAEAIAGHPKLHSVNLGRNNIGDEGVGILMDAMKPHSALRYLFIDENHITAEGGKRAAQALREGAPPLAHLNISRNGMASEGSIAIAEAMRENRSLHTLHIQGNHTDDETTRRVSSILRSSGNTNLFHLHTVKVDDEMQVMLKRNLDKARDLAKTFQWEKATLSAQEYRQMDKRHNAIAHVLDVDVCDISERLDQLIDRLPKLPEMDALPEGLFAKDGRGYAPLDNPRLWETPEAALDTMANLSLTKELAQRTTAKGGKLLEALANSIPAERFIGALNERGVKLGAAELLKEDDTANDLMTTLLEQKDGAQAIFSTSNWLGKSVPELRRVHAALPEGAPDIGLHSLQQAISHGKKSNGVGR